MATPTTLPNSFTSEILTSTAMNNIRGAFRVLQVVNGATVTQVNTSTSTYVDTGLTATITPQSSTSKILVLVNQTGCYKDTGNTYLKLQLLRGSTSLAVFEAYGGITGNANSNGFGACSTSYLDSPATTSATTYKTQMASGTNIAQVFTQVAGSYSTITLMEISA